MLSTSSSGTIMRSLSSRKWALSLCSFVKRSDGFSFPGTQWHLISPSCWHSATRNSLIFMCLVFLEAGPPVLVQLTAPVLSLRTGIARLASTRPSSVINYRINCTPLVPSSIAFISASHELPLIRFSRITLHCRGPPILVM